MAYTPTNWQTGDIVTAEKLNKLENGVAGGNIFIIHTIFDESTELNRLDKTWQEIFDAIESEKLPIIFFVGSGDKDVGLNFIVSAFESMQPPPSFETFYFIEAFNSSGSVGVLTYKASSVDDYPVLVEDDD